MTAHRRAGVLVLRDLATAAALLWLTVSDSWAAIAVSGALVASRVRGLQRLSDPPLGTTTAHGVSR